MGRVTPQLIDRLRRVPDDTGGAGGVGGSTQSAMGPVVLRKTFPYQSYYDSVALERAVLSQPPSELIVPSTRQVEEASGYGVAVYPASETPIAVQLGSSGSPFVLRPGEVFKSTQRFDMIRYGLPFGWLGGGTVQLRVLQGEHDEVSFFGEHDVLFHRVRLPLWGLAAAPALGIRGTSPNWPTKFPWPNAYDFNGNAQKGQPSLVVTPTKLAVRVRANVAAGFRMRLVLFQTDDFDLLSDGATYDTLGASASFTDLNWGPGAASGFTVGGAAGAEFSSMVVDASPLGGSNAIAMFIDMDGVAPVGTYIDVERFGRV